MLHDRSVVIEKQCLLSWFDEVKLLQQMLTEIAPVLHANVAHLPHGFLNDFGRSVRGLLNLRQDCTARLQVTPSDCKTAVLQEVAAKCYVGTSVRFNLNGRTCTDC